MALEIIFIFQTVKLHIFYQQMIVHRLIFNSLNGAGCLFVKRTGIRNAFNGVTLFWLSISDSLLHSEWTGDDGQRKPRRSWTCCIILSCQVYL